MTSRLLTLLGAAVLLVLLATSISWAQEDDGAAPILVNGHEVEHSTLPGPLIDGVAQTPPARLATQSILALKADDPADACEDATDIALVPESNPADGISFDVRNATEAPDDPVLVCMWGNPPRRQGFRTVWYRLVVPFSGRISLNTFGSSYDTVLGVYGGECGALQQVLCNDDANGFTSNLTVAASAGEVYYIALADWQPGLPSAATLNFSAFLQPVDSLWQVVDTKQPTQAISRHATVAHAGKIYVIGGQSGQPGESGVPFVSNQLLRLNPGNGNWKTMASIPGAGYSNTTAALVGDHIYLPSGYTGNDLGFDGLHWAYRIPTDADDPGSWSTVAPLPQKVGWAASAAPPSGTRYYLMGGTTSPGLFDGAAQASSATYVYIAEQDQWLAQTPMQTPRYAHTGTWIETNNLGACVAGGLAQSGDGFVFHTSAECFQPGIGWRFIGDMNIPRIGAGSVTGPDGKWYVFGGQTVIDNRLFPVLRTEVYDPRQGTWTLLPPEYNLGGQDALSARAFASGSVVGSDLYAIGGSIFVDGEHALPLTEKITLPPHSVFLPAQFGHAAGFLMPDDNFGVARPLPFGFHYRGNFDRQRDFYDFFSFDVSTTQNIRIELEVPDGNNFDLYLYGQNKLLWASSESALQGEDELIVMPALEPRRYYVLVKRTFPTGEPDTGASYDLVILN